MIKRHYNKDELLIYVEIDKDTPTLENKIVLLHFDSFCLGDTICFSSFIDSFIEYHKTKKVIVSTFFPHLFQSTSDSYEFINSNQNKRIIVDKLINVGYDKDNLNHTLGGMFYAAKDTMLLPQNIKPGKCPMVPYNEIRQEGKIVIAPESLKEIAQWNFFGSKGWQIVVDEIVKSGYDVYNVSYENTLNLDNVKGYHGFDDINVALKHILQSRVFIGLSSGLSWLAWAYDIPVVMISGFTKKYNEFECFRVVNEHYCNGCFNVFKNINTKCPLFLNTDRENECHKSITPWMVIDQINNAISLTKI